MKRIGLIARAIIIAFAAFFTFAPQLAFAQSMVEGMGRGVVGPMTPEERALFSDLLCTCGGCQREAIDTCTCEYAAERREKVRGWIKGGMNGEQVKAAYVKEYGEGALAIPPNEGKNRLVYLVPLVAIAGMAIVLATALKRLRGKNDKPGDDDKSDKGSSGKSGGDGEKDDYDQRLDDELRDLDR